jgi:hypothetical protein
MAGVPEVQIESIADIGKARADFGSYIRRQWFNLS